MTARKPATRKPAEKPATAPAADEQPIAEVAPPAEPTAPADEQADQNAEGQELAWCRIGRDLEEGAPECPRHEFEPGARLCNLHFVTRLDLREVARNDG